MTVRPQNPLVGRMLEQTGLSCRDPKFNPDTYLKAGAKRIEDLEGAFERIQICIELFEKGEFTKDQMISTLRKYTNI